MPRYSALKLLDTNVLLYALGRPHPYRSSCLTIFEQIREGSDAYAVDVELLQEVLHVYTLRGERLRGLEAFDLLLDILPEPIPITRREMVTARRLMAQADRLSPRDAVHAAVVLEYGFEGLVTTDRAFRDLHELRVFHPIDLSSP